MSFAPICSEYFLNWTTLFFVFQNVFGPGKSV